jgi:hypothetical protein
LDKKQLAYMRQQSSRAEITEWEFTNEYHFGDFRGNAEEMLRRGYDVHLHYANFGIRRLMFRLPGGLPCDRKLFEAFQPDDGVAWHADKKGPGGILEINPEGDADSFDELFEVEGLLNEIAPIRDMLMAGDLRPLYLAWLACPTEDEALEPPVPAGLGEKNGPLEEMAAFYDIHQDLIAAAAEQSPPLSKTIDAGAATKGWIAQQSPDDLRELVERLLAGNERAIRAEILARVRAEAPAVGWPTAEPTRTLGQLRQLAAGVGSRRVAREKKAVEAARQKRLKKIAADPDKLVAEVRKLVKLRSTSEYERAARELADLREALGPEAGPPRARAVAEELRRANPTLKLLVAALRKQGLLG